SARVITPCGAFLASRSAELTSQPDSALGTRIAINALPVIGRTGDGASVGAVPVPVGAVSGCPEFGATTAIHPNAARIGSPSGAFTARRTTQLADQLDTASGVSVAMDA